MTDKATLTLLLQLKAPWYISSLDIDVDAEEVHVYVNHGNDPLPCPECSAACRVEDHADERVWRHLDMWQAKTFIHCRMPRTRCAEHGVKRVAVPWAEPKSRFSMFFEERVIAAILACETVAGACDLMRISWDQARGIMERAVRRGLARRCDDPIPYLGVDEKSIRKGHRYVTVLTDLDGRRILDVQPGRTKQSLMDALESLDDTEFAGVRAVSMDMWEPFRTAVEETFPAPAPAIVHDRYHLVAHVNKAMNEVRKEEARELAKEGRDDLKGARQALLYEPVRDRKPGSADSLSAGVRIESVRLLPGPLSGSDPPLSRSE